MRNLIRPLQGLVFISLLLSNTGVAADQDPNRDDKFSTRFVYESRVTIDQDRPIVGDSKYGARGMVWITGGDFHGPRLKGSVIPGGGDWQLTRPDGSKELDARYALKTHDGFIIYVHNKVLTVPRPTEANPRNRYAKSVLSFEAPINSPYEWMNQSLFLGTLERAKDYGTNPAVIIRVWELL